MKKMKLAIIDHDLVIESNGISVRQIITDMFRLP
jgi:hypothetical protein